MVIALFNWLERQNPLVQIIIAITSFFGSIAILTLIHAKTQSDLILIATAILILIPLLTLVGKTIYNAISILARVLRFLLRLCGRQANQSRDLADPRDN